MFGHPEMGIYQKWNPLLASAHAACQALITPHSSQAPPPSTNHSSSIALHHPPVKTRPRRVKSEDFGARSSCAERPKRTEFSHGRRDERRWVESSDEDSSGLGYDSSIFQSWDPFYVFVFSVTKGIKLHCHRASWVLQPKPFTLFRIFLLLVNSNQARYYFCWLLLWAA